VVAKTIYTCKIVFALLFLIKKHEIDLNFDVSVEINAVRTCRNLELSSTTKHIINAAIPRSFLSPDDGIKLNPCVNDLLNKVSIEKIVFFEV